MANFENSVIVLIGLICSVVSVYLVKSGKIKTHDSSVAGQRLPSWLILIVMIAILLVVVSN